MELVEFTRLQDDADGIVETAEYHGRLARVKVLRTAMGSRVAIEVDGETVEEWSDAAPPEELIGRAESVAIRFLQQD